MADENPQSNPIPTGGEPLALTERQKELCRRLDDFYAVAKKTGPLPSERFRGALYSMQSQHRAQNPEWMAQVAHSLREILYPFYQSGADVRKEDAFTQYGSAGDVDALTKQVSLYFGFFTSVAHHNLDQASRSPIIRGAGGAAVAITDDVFEETVTKFEEVLFDALRRQLDAHAEIDNLIKNNTRDITTLHKLLDLNFDARRYFFSKVEAEWLEWLWSNDFLDAIKEIPEDTSSYTYRTPELDYLVRVVEKDPVAVTDIMLSVPSSMERFNPEVIDRFLWICQSLPATELARIAPKILEENWTKIIWKYSHWSFVYEKIFKTLAAAKDDKTILIFAEVLLAVRPKNDPAVTNGGYVSDNPFYFSELAYTRVFQYLAAVEGVYAKNALALATHTLGEIVKQGDPDEDHIFVIYDRFYLADEDFFSMTVSDGGNAMSRSDEVSDLVAVITTLTSKLIGTKCNDASTAKTIYDTYIKTLPDSQSMWRLRLFTMSLCPDVFKEDLRAAFFRIFDYEKPWSLLMGTEYELTIKKGFSTLSNADQRDYVLRTIEKFGSKSEGDIDSGWSILSSVYESLTDKEKNDAKEAFGKDLDPAYVPRPSVGHGYASAIVPKAPIDLETLSKMSVSDIVSNLKDIWSPEKLRDKDTERDFHRPLNAEGMSDLIKTDFNQRPQEYLVNADLFFDRDHLDAHYTYSFFGAIDAMLRLQKFPSDMDLGSLVLLLKTIAFSGKTEGFEPGVRRKDFDGWLAGWQAVQSSMASVLEELLKGSDEKSIIDFSIYRNDLFPVISFLLDNPDPVEKDEQEVPKKHPISGEIQYSKGDPFTEAINSVRGRAFQAFVMFVFRDGQTFPKDMKSKLSSEVIELYEKLLATESTQALMFMFGHYLSFFYFYDKDWMRNCIEIIFPVDPKKKDLFFAAWEGYLSRSLYFEVFEDLAGVYHRAIAADPAEYTARRYHVELDKGLASHIALAFMHFENFGYESELYKAFWDKNNVERHKEFVSFIGRHTISREKPAEWIRENKVNLEKVKSFWDWALQHCSNPEILNEFGFWMKNSDDLLDPKWLAAHVRKTLEKTGGNVHWELGMMQSLPELAKIAPEDSLQILRLYLTGPSVPNDRRRAWLYVDEELIGIFKILYTNPLTKIETEKLINELLPRGTGQFWRLKEVLQA